VPVDDVIEISNHFIVFDYLLDTIATPLANNIIKEFHRILKTGTADAMEKCAPPSDHGVRREAAAADVRFGFELPGCLPFAPPWWLGDLPPRKSRII